MPPPFESNLKMHFTTSQRPIFRLFYCNSVKKNNEFLWIKQLETSSVQLTKFHWLDNGSSNEVHCTSSAKLHRTSTIHRFNSLHLIS